MALFNLSVACGVGLCVAFNGSCQESRENVLCAECDWRGWLNVDRECVMNVLPLVTGCQPSSPVRCDGGDGECVVSGFGVRCSECLFRGYLEEDGWGQVVCRCYESSWDGAAYCTNGGFGSGSSVEKVVVSAMVDSVYCEAFQNALGFFKGEMDGGGVVGVYGDADLFTPRECCSSVYGPPPGQLVETDETRGFFECNTYGSFDPDEIALTSVFRTCSGHGVWDVSERVCVCDEKWNAVAIGTRCLEPQETVYSCRMCFGFWGPMPPLDGPLDEVEQLHCSVPMTPDENGELRECSGHGHWRDGACVCDYGEATGYWGLQMLSVMYERVMGNGTVVYETQSVEVCSVCASGAVGTGCQMARREGGVVVVTERPSVSAVVEAMGCLGCGYFGSVVIDAIGYLGVGEVRPVLGSECCTLGTVFVMGEGVLVVNGTCVETQEGLKYLGSVWCGVLSGCRGVTWSRVNDGIDLGIKYAFRFTGEDEFNLVISAGSGSGLACPPTHSPTVAPTRYPTVYPTDTGVGIL